MRRHQPVKSLTAHRMQGIPFHLDIFAASSIDSYRAEPSASDDEPPRNVSTANLNKPTHPVAGLRTREADRSPRDDQLPSSNSMYRP